LNVACAVIEIALENGLTTKLSPSQVSSPEALKEIVSRKMYDPVYVPLVDPSK